MRKKDILFLVFVMLAGLLLLFVSRSISSEKPPVGIDIKNLGLSAATKNIQPGTIVKPDIDCFKLPLYFIANKGQVNEKAKFYAKTSRYTLWLTEEGLVFDRIIKQDTGEKKEDLPMTTHQSTTHQSPLTKFDRDVSRLMFIGANKHPVMVPIDEAKLKVNYFIGNDRSKWHCDVPTSMAVLYKNLYKNIDLKVYGLEKQIEYDWIVKPGGDPADIRFEYRNVKGTRIDDKGDLVIDTQFGELIHQKPVGYQEKSQQHGSGEREKGLVINEGAALPGCPFIQEKNREYSDVKFKTMGENKFGFEAGGYDRSRLLIIDPVVLVYSTSLAGSREESGRSIVTDNRGNIYITGFTNSLDFPTVDPFQSSYEDGWYGYDAYIAKINTKLSGAASLIYSTYLGGNYRDCAYSIAADNLGNVYVTGETMSSDFPTFNFYQGEHKGGWRDVFITRLDTNISGASSLIYSTYLGGGEDETGFGIASNNRGIVHLVGITSSRNFPTVNAFQEECQDGWHDAFVATLDTNLSGDSSLIYSTYLGGEENDYGYGIAVDSRGYVYVTGSTASIYFPTFHPFQDDQGSTDAFITILNTKLSGSSSLLYSTYLGGELRDYGFGIAVADDWCVYVTGSTESNDFPTLNPYRGRHGKRHGTDVFITRLVTNVDGSCISSLIYSTYLGGGQTDRGFGIAADNKGNAYITGETTSSDFPLVNYLSDRGGCFVSRVNTDISGIPGLIYSTRMNFEDFSFDSGRGIAVDSSGYAYIIGDSWYTTMPFQNVKIFEHVYLNTHIKKLSCTAPPYVTTKPISNVTDTTASGGGNVTWEGDEPVTARGVCWSTNLNPSIKDEHTTDGAGNGPFTSYITGLTNQETYYVCAYAANAAGTSYGNTISFKTGDNPVISGSVKSTDGSLIPGVLLHFSNKGGTAMTNGMGIYRHKVPADWSGTATPLKRGYIFEPGNRTYQGVTSYISGHDYTARYLYLDIIASRETDYAWLIKRQYGRLLLTVDNPDDIPVATYRIYRLASRENYKFLTEIPASQFQGGTYLYYDRYLDPAKYYYAYKFHAVDANGKAVMGSDEKII